MDRQDHGSLALWAADCAEHVLPHFEEERPGDARPRWPSEAGRSFARREMKMSEARAAAYAVKAAQAADATDPSTAVEERDWQRQRLPEHLRPVAFIF